MKRLNTLSFILLTCAMLSCSGQQSGPSNGGYIAPQAPKPPEEKSWRFETTPVWSDEFEQDGAPDPSKWGYDLGNSGWGNHELENYTNSTDNAYIKDGVLYVTARKEASNGMQYSSARMATKGKGDWLYGRFEIKAKLPAGKGTWPAIWMLPTDWSYGDWPKSGELDIMEEVGYDPNVIHLSAHTEKYNHVINTQKTVAQQIPSSTSDFHVYRLDWTPAAVHCYIDDQLYFTFKNEGTGSAAWPFDKRFHLLLNLAIGGDWGGIQGVDDTAFPCTMQVDYVRVYKLIDN